MLWDKLTEENYVVYVNRDIDLKIKEYDHTSTICFCRK